MRARDVAFQAALDAADDGSIASRSSSAPSGFSSVRDWLNDARWDPPQAVPPVPPVPPVLTYYPPAQTRQEFLQPQLERAAGLRQANEAARTTQRVIGVDAARGAALVGLKKGIEKSDMRRRRLTRGKDKARVVAALAGIPQENNNQVKEGVRDVIRLIETEARNKAGPFATPMSWAAEKVVRSLTPARGRRAVSPQIQRAPSTPTARQAAFGMGWDRTIANLKNPAAVLGLGLGTAAAAMGASNYPVLAGSLAGYMASQKLFGQGAREYLTGTLLSAAEKWAIPPLVAKQIEDRLILRIQNGLKLEDSEDMFDPIQRPKIYQELANFAKEEGIDIKATPFSNITPGSNRVVRHPRTGLPVASEPQPPPAKKLFAFIVTNLIQNIMYEMHHGAQNFNWLIEDYETRGQSLGPKNPYGEKNNIDCYSLISIFVDILHGDGEEGEEILNALLKPSVRGPALTDPVVVCQVIIKYLKCINPSKESTPAGEEILPLSDMLTRLAFIYAPLYYEGPQGRKSYLDRQTDRGLGIYTRLNLSTAQ